MCVNDIICCGAKPLFFLDYIACGKNYPEKIAQIVSGVAEGCVQSVSYTHLLLLEIPAEEDIRDVFAGTTYKIIGRTTSKGLINISGLGITIGLSRCV